jgi:hypothetical protein
LVVVVTALLGACGGTTDADAGTAREWARTICAAVGDWSDKLASAQQSLEPPGTSGDTASAATAISTYLGTAIAASERLIAQIERAGIPDVEHGDELARDFREVVAEFAGQTAATQSQLDGVAVPDPTAVAHLRDIYPLIEVSLGEARAGIARVATRYPSSELGEDLAEEPACVAL